MINMEGEEAAWDAYFAKLRDLIGKNRLRLNVLIEEEVKREIDLRGNLIDAKPYVDIALSFIDEKLYELGEDKADFIVRSLNAEVSAEEMMEAEISSSWYDYRDEKEEIDYRIQTGLNLRVCIENLVDSLIAEFGVFPSRTIITAYDIKPNKNHLPDYALALALQRLAKSK